ncbi:MAG TPA: glycoside hydrolase family 16 protein [Prolixibacteraceae bacterium]|nr:glycoside hydrolase family 16 protein [Prolixibacteraceae bacterium]
MKNLLLSIILGFTISSSMAQNPNPRNPDTNFAPKIPGMKLVWNEEFENCGKLNPEYWKFEKGFVRNEELQWYQENNAICANGVLIIEGRHEKIANPNYQAGSQSWKTNREFARYTSSSINTRGLKQWLYGRFEVRARIDTTMGSWPAIWTLGLENSWPLNGEIDLMEFYRINDTPTILANVAWGTNQKYVAKWQSKKTPFSEFKTADPDWAKKFHIWRMDWTPESIMLYLDDVLLNTTPLSETINPDGSNPFTKPQYLLLNLAIGGNGGNPETSTFPIRYEVDYVRIYQSIEK